MRIAPEQSLVHFHLGIAYENSGQFNQAEEQIRISLSARERPNAFNTLGLVLMYQSREREAIAAFQRALQLGPERAAFWMNLGTAYRRTGDAPNAVRAFHRSSNLAEHALAANPRLTLSRAFLAYSSAQLGDSGRAETEIAQALKQAPLDADVLFMAAITFEALHDREAALAALAGAPHSVIADLSRWPDVADLGRDSRFIRLLSVRNK